MLGPFLTRLGREHANDTFRLHAPRRHEFHCRKGSPGSFLLYSQLGIQADGLVLRTSSWLVPSWKMLILGPKRRVRSYPLPPSLSVSPATAHSFLFVSRLSQRVPFFSFSSPFYLHSHQSPQFWIPLVVSSHSIGAYLKTKWPISGARPMWP